MQNANDLLNTKFEKKMGGYKAADVDSFMVEVASLFSQQNRDTAELKRKLEAAQAKLSEYEKDQDSLREALLSAQKLADSIVNEAREKARSIQTTASQQAEQSLFSIRDEIEAEKQKLAGIKREVSAFRSKLMNMYRAHIELINELPAVQEESEPENPEPAPVPAVAETPASPEPQKPEEPAAETAQIEVAAALEPEIVPAPEPEPEAAPEPPVQEIGEVKLNVRFDEETGEYVPLTEAGRRAMDRGRDSRNK